MKHEDWQNLDAEQLAIARMVEVRLRSNAVRAETSSTHPDSDLMNSFVEGRLESDQEQFLISHLVKCSSCRQLTAQLARATPDENEVGNAIAPIEEPSLVDGLIERLRRSFVPSTDDAVFAYQETDQTAEENHELEKDSGNKDGKTIQ